MEPDEDLIEDIDMMPCPFCGSSILTTVDWCDDSGEYPAIECAECHGAAPAGVWNMRVSDVENDEWGYGND